MANDYNIGSDLSLARCLHGKGGSFRGSVEAATRSAWQLVADKTKLRALFTGSTHTKKKDLKIVGM